MQPAIYVPLCSQIQDLFRSMMHSPFNKRRIKKGLPPGSPIYTQADAATSMKLLIGVPYDIDFGIDENIKVKFTNTGHMLGSGVANIQIIENGQIKRIAYTGDIGRLVDQILAPPTAFPQADILITESTYGDRLHNDTLVAEEELLNVVVNTCVNKGGKAYYPCFQRWPDAGIVFL